LSHYVGLDLRLANSLEYDNYEALELHLLTVNC
jgi:hypothetical protein